MSDFQKNFKVVADAYPVIAEKIKLFWGYQEFTNLVNDLLHNTRDKSRGGFPMHVTAALFELQERHDKRFPELAQKTVSDQNLGYRSEAF